VCDRKIGETVVEFYSGIRSVVPCAGQLLGRSSGGGDRPTKWGLSMPHRHFKVAALNVGQFLHVH